MTSRIPRVLWFGRTDGEWPIRCFETEDQAKRWLAEPNPVNKRHLFLADVRNPIEYELVTPEPVLVEVQP